MIVEIVVMMKKNEIIDWKRQDWCHWWLLCGCDVRLLLNKKVGGVCEVVMAIMMMIMVMMMMMMTRMKMS